MIRKSHGNNYMKPMGKIHMLGDDVFNPCPPSSPSRKRGGIPLIFLFVLLTLSVSSGTLWAAGNGGNGIQINLLNGSVFKRTPGAATETILTKGHLLRAGHRIRTGKDAQLELVFPDGCVLRLGSASVLRIVSADGEKETAAVRAALVKGNLWFNAPGAQSRGLPAAIATEVSIAATMSGVFRITVHPSQATEIKAYVGTIDVSGPPGKNYLGGEQGNSGSAAAGAEDNTVDAWHHQLSPLRKLVAWPSGPVTKPFRFAAKADKDFWVRWNLERDGAD